MLAGSMEHRDHKGNRGLLTGGSIQWMTAGRGIIHSGMGYSGCLKDHTTYTVAQRCQSKKMVSCGAFNCG